MYKGHSFVLRLINAKFLRHKPEMGTRVHRIQYYVKQKAGKALQTPKKCILVTNEDKFLGV